MSLDIICMECNKTFAYFSGTKEERFRFDKNIDKIFTVSKSEGNRGVTFDDSILTNTVYICEDCLNKLPNVAKFVKGEKETEKECDCKEPCVECNCKKEESNTFDIIIKCEDDEYGYATVWDGAGDDGKGDMRIQCYQSRFKKEELLDKNFNDSRILQISKSYLTEIKNKKEAVEEFFNFWSTALRVAIIAPSIEEAIELLKDSKVETAIIKSS